MGMINTQEIKLSGTLAVEICAMLIIQNLKKLRDQMNDQIEQLEILLEIKDESIDN